MKKVERIVVLEEGQLEKIPAKIVYIEKACACSARTPGEIVEQPSTRPARVTVGDIIFAGLILALMGSGEKD